MLKGAQFYLARVVYLVQYFHLSHKFYLGMISRRMVRL